MFTVGALAAGGLAAFVIGFSKTAVPGAALLAVPLLAFVFEGRLIAGGTLPVLLIGDTLAVRWYGHHTRGDVVRALAPGLGVGFVAGIAFFVAVGDADRSLRVAIGIIVLAIVILQIARIVRRRPAPAATADDGATCVGALGYGSVGGFTTFVANAAGPVVNAYLVARRLPKEEVVGTSAWLYLAINLAKVPLYLALGAWTAGGPFFTAGSLGYNALVAPAVVAGALAGRALFPHLPERAFLALVLVLSAIGGLRLLL